MAHPIIKSSVGGGSDKQIDMIRLALGGYRDASAVHKFGHNEAVGATFETVWSAGGLYAYPSAATVLSVSSADAADNGASSPLGTGARTILITGLDASYAEISETVTLTGTTPVVTTASFLRVNRANVVTVGSGGVNTGAITITDTTSPAVTIASIEALLGQSLMAVYTVPVGYCALVTHYDTYTDSAKATEVTLMARELGGSFRVQALVHLYQTTANAEFSVPIDFPEKTDIEMRASAVGGGGRVSGTFDTILIKL